MLESSTEENQPKLGGDGEMFVIELTEGQAINNDIFQDMALEEAG